MSYTPRPAVIHFAETTSLSLVTDDQNQLAPSAARKFLPLIFPVTTSASIAEIHSEVCHAASSNASVRSPVTDELQQEDAIINVAIAQIKGLVLSFIIMQLLSIFVF